MTQALPKSKSVLTKDTPYLALTGKLCHFGGLMQERHNSIAYALELRLSCTNPSINVLVQERRDSSVLAMELRLSCTNPSIVQERRDSIANALELHLSCTNPSISSWPQCVNDLRWVQSGGRWQVGVGWLPTWCIAGVLTAQGRPTDHLTKHHLNHDTNYIEISFDNNPNCNEVIITKKNMQITTGGPWGHFVRFLGMWWHGIVL